MRRHRTGQPLRLLAVACLALLASACTTNLTSVRDFAATSFDAAQYSQLVVAYVETPARLKRYEPQSQWPELDRQASERQAQRQQLLLRHKLVQDYMSALGQLAADGLPIYDNELDALGKAVQDAKFADQGEAAAFAAVSKLLVTAVTDRWRQGKLETLIEQSNAPFQVVVGAMVKVVEQGFSGDAAIERIALDKYYTTLQREGRDAAGLAALAEWREFRTNQLATHDADIRNYVIVLKTIGQGHQKLYETRNQLSKPEVEADIQRYANRLKEAFNAVKGL
jgi:hypothetical protein